MLVLILLFTLISGGLADFGSFSGDSDFGSSSSWSSDSSDWGSSSSWSSSSSDWGSSSSWSSGSSDWGGTSYWSSSPSYHTYSSGSGSSSGRVFFGSGTLFIIFIVFVFIILISRGKHSSSGGTSIPAGAQPTLQSRLKPMDEYPSIDPAFNADVLRERLGNLYVRMQNAWTNKDISELRPYFTDALYNQYAHQAEMFKTSGRTNYVERIAVLGTNLRGYYQQEGYDHIIVEMRTRIVDYTLDDATGNLISGSRTKEKFMTYEWNITRKTGVATKDDGNIHTVNCPNCGAPLSINTTSVCPYCDSVVTVSNEDWAIVEIKGISQYTR